MPENSSSRERERRILEHALELAGEARAEYLARECRDDEELRRSIDRLIRRAEDEPDTERIADRATPEDSIHLHGETTDDSAWATVLDKLRSRGPGHSRYVQHEQIAAGGMGTIERMFDQDLGRHIARKVIKESGTDPVSKGPTVDDVALGRFLEEAQVTGQLDHPAIVPVHEMGVDGGGRVYFAMKLVRGETLRWVISRVHDRSDAEWTLTRAISLLLRVCEAMRYAHAKGVIHRDLKPTNVMVGRFDEVYVMDWGLARVIGRADSHDLRWKNPPTPATGHLRSMRQEVAEAGDSPLLTMDGLVVGTPSYMPLEQAEGRVDDIDPRSDVYSLGAILYEILVGQPPYLRDGMVATPRTVLRWVLDGPPEPIHKLMPEVPQELVAICEKAMSRRKGDRYPDVTEMARDLRAFQDVRVVRAYRTGPLAELTKWAQRNRAAAVALAALFAVVAVTASYFYVQREQLIRDAHQLLEARLERDSRELIAEADAGWTIAPSEVEDMRRWLAWAGEVTSHLPKLRAELDEIRDAAPPYSDAVRQIDATAHPDSEELTSRRERRRLFAESLADARRGLASDVLDAGRRDKAEEALAILPGELAFLDARIGRLTWIVERRRTANLPDEDLQRRHDRLTRLVDQLERLADAEHGEIERVTDLVRRASALREGSVVAAEQAWAEAIADIRASERYGRLVIRPQLGLIPIGEDPRSGMWEFVHVLSGDAPTRNADGELQVRPETGVVLVLMPGGEFLIGAQPDPTKPNYDSDARDAEQPVRRVRLDPFFIGKYELTQAQWRRAAGRNPSGWFAGLSARGVSRRITSTHPVENMPWSEAARVLRDWGLELPTEAQLEYATRAGRETAFWTGGDFDEIAPRVNHADRSVLGMMRPDEPPRHHDGYALHAPVDAFGPNGFGLYHVLGNVWEWCRDAYCSDYDGAEFRPGDGELRTDLRLGRIIRGGGFTSSALDLRCATRRRQAPATPDRDIGVRAVRALDP